MRNIVQRIFDNQAGSSTRASLRAAGDQARDAKHWAGAAEAYRNYLFESPRDAAIWTQYAYQI